MTALAPLLVGFGVLCVALGFVQRTALRRRAPALAVAEASGALGAWLTGSPRTAGAPRKRGLPPLLGYVERRAKTAGIDWDLNSVMLLIAGSGLAAALVIYLATGVLWMTALAFCAGFYAPIWRLSRLTSQRANQVMRQLDQVCVELVQALSSGLDPNTAMRRQAERAPDPVGRELRRMMLRVKDGEPLSDAVMELPERIALEEARLFAVGVRLAMDAGTRMIPVLESIQRSLRSRREMHGLIRELSVRDEKSSVVLFIVPIVMLLAMRLEAPQFTAPLLHTAFGQLVLLGDLLWMLFGMQLVRSFFGATPVR